MAETRFDAALAVYRRIGAGAGWSERVQRERARPAVKSTHVPQAAAQSPRYPDGLSEREVEVLRLVAAGKSNQQIAGALVISQNTVLHHLSHIFDKTAAGNRTEAAAYAALHGLLDR